MFQFERLDQFIEGVLMKEFKGGRLTFAKPPASQLDTKTPAGSILPADRRRERGELHWTPEVSQFRRVFLCWISNPNAFPYVPDRVHRAAIEFAERQGADPWLIYATGLLPDRRKLA